MNVCPDLLHYLAALEDIGIRGIRQGRNLKKGKQNSKSRTFKHVSILSTTNQTVWLVIFLAGAGCTCQKNYLTCFSSKKPFELGGNAQVDKGRSHTSECSLVHSLSI